jgi:hypothetical protein
MSDKPLLNVGPSNPIYRWILEREQESTEASLPVFMSRLRGAAPPLASPGEDAGLAIPTPLERGYAPSHRRGRRRHPLPDKSASEGRSSQNGTLVQDSVKSSTARCPLVRAASRPVSNESQKPVTTDALVNTCREISKLLGQAKASPALRIAAPQLAEALPLVKALVLGVEHLANRVALIEAPCRCSDCGRLLEKDGSCGRCG